MKFSKQLFSKTFFSKSTLNRFININNQSVWILFNELAAKLKATNLVSGFPNWDPPAFLIDSIKSNIMKENLIHQRTSSNGHPFLLETLAKHYSQKYNRKIDSSSEICVTPGANYAINHSILSLLQEGDEVVALEPFYPEYLPEAYMAGGAFKGVPLISYPARSKEDYHKVLESKRKIEFINEKDEWKLDCEALRKAFNKKTRIFILNNPNNPTGKIFTESELSEIANVLKDFPRIIVVSDEVYEKVYFDDNLQDIPRFANIPNMWERTISVLSAGKIFSATGIRIGWAIGPCHLIKPIIEINARNLESLYSPVQLGVAEAFIRAEESYKGEKSYHEWSRKKYLNGRNKLLKSLAYSSMDFKFWTPQSGYFVIADFKNISFDKKYYFYESENKYSSDYAFALWLANEKKMVGVPMSVFYSPENKHLAQHLIRFACCKTDDYLKNVEKLLDCEEN